MVGEDEGIPLGLQFGLGFTEGMNGVLIVVHTKNNTKKGYRKIVQY